MIYALGGTARWAYRAMMHPADQYVPFTVRGGITRLQNQDESALRDHVFSTHITLRYGMAVLAIVLPLLLWGIGKLAYGIELQPSMNHDYFASSPDYQSGTAPRARPPL